MNDAKIRSRFHRKNLRRHHQDEGTLVIDELGLKHGTCRADIAVINGHLVGYEIKSDEDSLRRLTRQVDIYNAVFDRASVIVSARHYEEIEGQLPEWWGILLAREGARGGVYFETARRATLNPSVDNHSVVQLLWRNEAEEELAERGYPSKLLRQKRAVLYRELVSVLQPAELRAVVRRRLKGRTNWRRQTQLSPSDGLYPHNAT